MAEQEWVFIGLDEKMARRQGMPARIPVPKDKFEGLADEGLRVELVRAWIKTFLTDSELGKSGAWRKANSKIVSALEAFIDKAPVWERAQKAFAENDYEKAMSSLKRITTMDPDDHAARLNIAFAQANAGDHAGALKSFQAVKATFTGDPDYHVAVGHIHMAAQRVDDAIEQMVLALEAKPDCQPALDALVKLGVLAPIYENPRDAASLTYVRADSVAEYLTGEWDKEPRSVEFFLEQLAYHEREVRWGVALAAAERAVKASQAAGGHSEGPPPGANGGDATLERAEIARAAALRQLGRREDALAAIEAFLAKQPSSAGAWVEHGGCLRALGRADEAKASVEKALEADPGDLQALASRFWPEDPGDLKAVHAALPALEAFVEAHAASAGAWRSLARAKLTVGQKDEALALFAKAVALAPSDDDLRAEQWTELGKLERFEEILAQAATIEDLPKRDWKLRWNEAEAYSRLGKKIEARACFAAINFDDRLHVDVRRRAKRAVNAIDEGGAGEAPPAG
jgi:tetratricopeptide (TPR) repeat protein